MLTCVHSGAKPTLGSPQSPQFLIPLELPGGGGGGGGVSGSHLGDTMCPTRETT